MLRWLAVIVLLASSLSAWPDTEQPWIWVSPSQGLTRNDLIPINKGDFPAIAFCEIGDTKVPVFWKAVNKGRPDGKPHGYYHFVSDHPALELQFHSKLSGIPQIERYWATVMNRGQTTVTIPCQPSAAFSLGITGQSQCTWIEKGAGHPTDHGVHTEPITENYLRVLRSTPYSNDEPDKRDAIPWVAIGKDRRHSTHFAGIEFSGRVQIELVRNDRTSLTGLLDLEATTFYNDRLNIVLGLEPVTPEGRPFRTTISPGGSFETPVVFLGNWRGDVDEGANQMKQWVRDFVRPKMPISNYPPLVNNSWGSGMAVDETLARRMIDECAALGLEIYHLDAGWYRNVGVWHPLPSKFPHGLAPIADYAHSKGLGFGLWVGWTQGGDAPSTDSRVASLSPLDPKQKDWFGADYSPNWRPAEFTGADVCLAKPQAEQWCLNELRRMVRDYKLDLLEHDQRMIIDTCIRGDHGHTSAPADIAYHACRAYYRIHEALLREFPKLLMEDCVNGGRMVDLGVAQHVHYICVTDTYTPLANRRAFYDASYVLPQSMIEAYLQNEPVKSLPEFASMLRSGMMGWCTVMCDTSQWNPEQHAAARRQFDIYKKKLRPIIAHANLYHVSERPDGVRWDGIQLADPLTGNGVLYAFRGTTSETLHRFPCRALQPGRRYALSYEDRSSPDTVIAAETLQTEGLPITLPDPSSSELVFISLKD